MDGINLIRILKHHILAVAVHRLLHAARSLTVIAPAVGVETTPTDGSPAGGASKLGGGGALASLFQVEISEFKGNWAGDAAENFSFLCKASNFPTSSIDVTEINYMGRPFRIPGNRAAQDWTTSIYNDENFAIRNALENWITLQLDHAAIGACGGPDISPP